MSPTRSTSGRARATSFPHPGGGVRFTSYINNLHPVKYRCIYDTIEKLIESVLPAWDLCLGVQKVDQSRRGRHESRFAMAENPS